VTIELPRNLDDLGETLSQQAEKVAEVKDKVESFTDSLPAADFIPWKWVFLIGGPLLLIGLIWVFKREPEERRERVAPTMKD